MVAFARGEPTGPVPADHVNLSVDRANGPCIPSGWHHRPGRPAGGRVVHVHLTDGAVHGLALVAADDVKLAGDNCSHRELTRRGNGRPRRPRLRRGVVNLGRIRRGVPRDASASHVQLAADNTRGGPESRRRHGRAIRPAVVNRIVDFQSVRDVCAVRQDAAADDVHLAGDHADARVGTNQGRRRAEGPRVRRRIVDAQPRNKAALVPVGVPNRTPGRRASRRSRQRRGST